MEIDLSKFPDDWDIDNEQQYNYYKKCEHYAKDQGHFDNVISKSKYFYAYGVFVNAYFVILGLMLFKHRHHYIFKRQGRIHFFLFIFGSILSSLNSFLVQIYYKIYPCIILNLLLAAGYPLTLFSYAMIILTNFKNYYNSQIAYIEMFQNNKKKKDKKHIFIFKYIYQNMPQTKVTPFFVYYLVLKWMIVYILYFFNSNVNQNGFCKMSLIHIPQIMEVIIFLIVFLPLALIEVLKFDDTFRMKKKIINSILTTMMCFCGYMALSSVKSINCSIIVKYIPSDSFVILLYFLSSIFLCVPTVKDIMHINKQKAETKATQNGMLRMLEDNVLLREFSEFCRKENCTENILFYQHYWKYQRLFDSRDRNSRVVKSNYYGNTTSNYGISNTYDFDDHDHSQMSFEVEGSVCEEGYNPSMINGMEPNGNVNENVQKKSHFISGRKFTRNDILLKESRNIINDFILNDSKFEVNISDKVKKAIVFNFKELKNNELQQQDFKERLKCLFDEAYNEVINSLFLNSYSNYILQKKMSNPPPKK